MHSIKLYINSTLVEFNEPPAIAYNYKLTDFENPLDVKNGYSKTVVIPGTKSNNRLFDSVWRLDRTQSPDSQFNPSKKADFFLYIDGVLYESGYVKLDTVKRNDTGFWEYGVTLYSGIGEFLYNLTYNSNGEKLKLSDIWLGAGAASARDTELDMTINQQEIWGAWACLGTTWDQTWDDQRHQVLTYVPCYNGKPKNFSTNKVVLNMRGTPFSSSAISDGQTYTTIGGFALGDLAEDIDEWGMRDLRDWCQRPAIRMKKIVEACTYPVNNSGSIGNTGNGYTVELDPDFFNSSNPAWEDTWLTLPRIDEIEYQASQEIQGTFQFSGSTSNGEYSAITKPWVTTYETDIDTSGQTLNGASVSFKLNLHVTGGTLDNDSTYLSLNTYSLSDPNTPIDSFEGAIMVQLVGYNNYGKAVAGSDVAFITNVHHWRRNGMNRGGSGGESAVVPEFNDFTAYTPTYSAGTIGYREYRSGFSGNINTGNYLSADNFVLTIDSSDRVFSSLKLIITKVTALVHYRVAYPPAQVYQNINRLMFNTRTEGDFEHGVNRVRYTFIDTITPQLTATLHDNTGAEVSSKFSSGKSGLGSGSFITKKNLLNTQYTPADYLLSYCKMFGLYLIKDVSERKVSILTRKNFFLRNKVDNIESIIDHGREWTITPLTFDTKYYDFAPTVVQGTWAKDYSATTNVAFGIQRVDTGYDFNAEKTVVTDKLAFKSCVEGLAKSPYYTVGPGGDGVYTWKLWMKNGFKYTLYGTGESTTQVEVPTGEIDLSAINQSNRKYYDFTPKPEFRNGDAGVAGENVLLFYNGKKTTTEGTNPFKYYLSSDLMFMNNYNGGNSCWLYTTSELDIDGEPLATEITELPVFERYRTVDDSNDIMLSLDFGTPRQLYVPDYTESGNDTVYARNWKTYFEDLYDIDAKILLCYCRITEVPNPGMFRKFYWFQNSIWRLNSIVNWVPGQLEPTQCEFVRVQNLNNYTTNRLADEQSVGLRLSRTTITDTGATLTATITTSQSDVPWIFGVQMADDVENFHPTITVSPTAGTGTAICSITIPANTTEHTIRYIATVTGPYNSAYKMIEQLSEYDWYVALRNDGTVIGYTDDLSTTVFLDVINARVTSASCATANYVSWGQNYVDLNFDDNITLGFVNHDVFITATTANGGDEYLTYHITQIPEKLEFPATGGTKTLTSNVPLSSAGPWWLQITDSGNTHIYQAAPNTDTVVRSSGISFSYNNAVEYGTVSQGKNSGKFLTVSPTSFIFDNHGSTQYLTITTNSMWGITTPSWVTASTMTGSGNAVIAITTGTYAGTSDRTGNIVVNGEGNSVTIPVIQYRNYAGRALRVSTDTSIIPADGGVVNINILYNQRGSDTVTPSANVTGVTFGEVQWFGETGTVRAVVPGSASARTITFTVTPGSALASAVSVSVTQTGEEDYLITSKDDIRFHYYGGSDTFTINTNKNFEIVLSAYGY